MLDALFCADSSSPDPTPKQPDPAEDPQGPDKKEGTDNGRSNGDGEHD